jgi:phytoene desaturase
MPSRRVVVVGAGLAGLSAACHLRGAGHEVTIIEAGDVPGGRAGTAELGGYRFDTGPTVLTMPHLVEQCFRAIGTTTAEHVALRTVDPMYRACFADGTELRVRHGREAMTAEIRAVCGSRDADRFGRFCDWLTELYGVEMPRFIDRNYDSPLDLLRPPGPAIDLVRLGAFRRLSTKVGRTFDDDRLRRVFSFQAMYAGLAPTRALAIYAVITYMDAVNGVFVPEGGMHALPVALAGALEHAGVTIRYGTRAAAIERTGGGGRLRAVRLADGESLAADAVVCTVDLPVAYRTLLPDLQPPRATRRGSYSPSAMVWHVGVRGSLPTGVEHHNIHFGRTWERAFGEMLDDGRRMSDPSILVTVPTLAEPSMAPPDRHVLYVLEPVPNLDGRVDWTAERDIARRRLAAHVSALGYPDDIEVETLVDPRDWQAQGMERGTPFALAHRFLQSGPFRPANVDRRAPGVVFAGSGTQPGVGIPMVLVSGRLAAERVAALSG